MPPAFPPLDGSKLANLGWRNRTSFEDGLAATVDWFRENEPWWRPLKEKAALK